MSGGGEKEMGKVRDFIKGQGVMAWISLIVSIIVFIIASL